MAPPSSSEGSRVRVTPPLPTPSQPGMGSDGVPKPPKPPTFLQRTFLNPKYLIDGKSKWKFVWDMYILAVMGWILIILPIRASFFITTGWSFGVTDVITDCSFLLDSFLTFFTSYQSRGIEVKDQAVITQRYLRGWFIPDVISILPIDYIMYPILSNIHYPAFRVNRLIRICKINSYYTKIEDRIVSILMFRMGRQALVVLATCHFVACMFNLLIQWENPPSDLFLGSHNKMADFQNLSSTSRYLRSLYWALISTTGYGNTAPDSLVETIFTLCVVVGGLSMYLIVIATVGSLLNGMGVATSEFRQKMDTINDYMSYRNIPTRTRLKVTQYYQYLWDTRQGMDEMAILEDLPKYLRVEVAWVLNKDMIEKVPLFQMANEAFKATVSLHLTPRTYLKDSVIVTKGEVASEMFFINAGSVEVLGGDDGASVVFTMKDGGFFGEVGLIYKVKRTATVRAGSMCDLFVLTKATFDQIIAQFPDASKVILDEAEKRFADQNK